ncbi:MAG TPA: response regulator [Candidatus Nitrosocosmicus sp.]|jgi:CheY-like chemotaxis protein|nr:response regulator [Candidatus Nitrosocosmicus sp.]
MMPSACSIMVVDDESELATLFKTFLDKEGHTTFSFTDPTLALEYFRQAPDKHSLIITDLRMPSLSGLQLARKIRELNMNVKIFLMTAFETKDLENEPEYKHARIDKLIQKPIRFSDLRLLVNEALNI